MRPAVVKTPHDWHLGLLPRISERFLVQYDSRRDCVSTLPWTTDTVGRVNCFYLELLRNG